MIIIPKSNLYEAKINFNQFDLVDFNVTKSGERFFAKRVRLRSNKFTHFITRFFLNRNNPKSLVKKSVRVDEDLYSALCDETHNNKIFFTKTISEAVLNTISTGQIDLIDAKWFSHKITVYFTQEENKRIEEVLTEIRNKKIEGVTYSKLVRSILYKRLGIVMEFETMKNDRNILPKRGTNSGMATNPINHTSYKQQSKYNKATMKGAYNEK